MAEIQNPEKTTAGIPDNPSDALKVSGMTTLTIFYVSLLVYISVTASLQPYILVRIPKTCTIAQNVVKKIYYTVRSACSEVQYTHEIRTGCNSFSGT